MVAINHVYCNAIITSKLGADAGVASDPKYHEYYQSGEKISLAGLNTRGLRLTGRFMVVSDGYKIYELRLMDGSLDLEKSFLTPDIRMRGVILAGGFSEHKIVAGSNSAPASRISKTRPMQTLAMRYSTLCEESGEPVPRVINSEDPRCYSVDV